MDALSTIDETCLDVIGYDTKVNNGDQRSDAIC